ncbi:gamma-glutamyltransferase [Aureimonas populi]|uniref:Glutathione hydrolase proenzyme n=1 Tax=Aureimonas populi TaxID=1701758 RepID=A0ABW5CQX9_9HYPH|nr:gamma-glutamyltransferase [Aureimonas populi]
MTEPVCLPLPFACEKVPASGAGGVVVTNHPLGSAAGLEMLTAGGNAVDAAVAALLALTVVEPMMVGIAGGGLSHLRLADGRHLVIDALSTAAAGMHPDIYRPVSEEPARYMEAEGRRNIIGASSVAVPGNLAGWCDMQARFGRLPFADVVEPAIRLAARGFTVTHYLAGSVHDGQADIATDPEMARLLLPGGRPVAAGERLVMGDYAESLRLIQAEGAAALHGGALGAALAARMRTGGPDAGWVSEQDLADYRPVERRPIVGRYRGFEVVGPPPPASSGVHVAQMLNMLEAYDVAGMGFGTPGSLHLLAEVIRIAFADRRAHSGDPDFVDVPVERLTSRSYAAECRARIGLASALPPAPGHESRDTTHVTVADRDGNIVSATHTINGLFGARVMVPGTGIILNNYMSNFDPHPGRALSVVPGKRVPTSMAPLMVLREGRPVFALGLPGGLRIFPSAMQAIVNLIDHGMSLQEAVEAPRIWTEGQEVEIEQALAPQQQALESMGHRIRVMPHIGGGMNAIAFEPDGTMTGAACWRADGTVAALGGGLARPGVRFWPDRAPAPDPALPDMAEPG